MKYILLPLLFITQFTFAQNKKGYSFITTSFNLSLAINEEYTLEDDDQPLLLPTAIMMRVGFGYQFNKRLGLSFNAGYDNHYKYSIKAIPTYLSLRYHIWENDGDAFFAEYGQGKMWRPIKKYSDGNYYNFGLGWQMSSSSKWKPILRFAYHRKKIAGFENGSLDSVSLGFGFTFF
ncbi:MAG: hypothetical protein JXQ93_01765 [Flavobacteriaceae bacterium]